MTWTVEFHPTFAEEVAEFERAVKIQLAVSVSFLEDFGPQLKRPYADTLKGSSHSNMKELRFNAGNGVWRIAYAFDPERKAILLVGGDKSGTSQKRFYKNLITKADKRFSEYLEELEEKDS